METFAYKKILAATDYTGLSENAVNTAAKLCRVHKSSLVLLHVVEGAVPFDEHHLNLDYSKELKNFAKSQFREVANSIRHEYGIAVEEIVSYGDVAREIVQAIRENGPDLTLIGTHGKSGFRRLFIGSNSYRVIKHSTSPVMTVPGEGDWTGFRNILFPVRLVPNPLESYDVVRPIVQMNGSSLIILGLTLDSDTDKMKDVMVLERSLEERLRLDGAPFEVTYGHCHHYAEKILEVADEKNADLIVVPDTLDHTFREFFIGPVAQQVIHHAKVPVLCTFSQ